MDTPHPDTPGILTGRTRPLGGRVAQAEMRAANMGLLLRHLRTHGGRSRARLAQETGLSKATTSTLVADLAERGLVREGEVVRGGAVGRPGQMVTLDGAAVAGLGVEIGVDRAAYTALTLSGTVIRESVLPLDVLHLGVATVLDRTSAQLRRLLDSLRTSGVAVAGITVSPSGIIDYESGALRFAPHLGWRDIPLAAEFAQRLGGDHPQLHLENDAKLAALAEYESHARQGVRDLLYLTGEVGIGAGIIAGGRLVRGWSGYSGEVGHLPLAPEPTPCSCGRHGCWETVVGLAPFLTLATTPTDPLRDPARPVADRLDTLRERADAGDPVTLRALATITEHLTTGLAILVDVLNPRTIVLGGYFAHFGDHLLGPLTEALAARRMPGAHATGLTTSQAGLMSAARGGALLALEDVFANPLIVAPRG